MSNSNKSSISFILSEDMPSSPSPSISSLSSSPSSPSSSISLPNQSFNKSSTQETVSLKIIQQPLHAKVSPKPNTTTNSYSITTLSEHRPIHPPPVLQLSFNNTSNPNTKKKFSNNTHLLPFNDQAESEFHQTAEVISLLNNNGVMPHWAHLPTYFVSTQLVDIEDGKHYNDYKNALKNQDIKINNDDFFGSSVCSGMRINIPSMNSSSSPSSNIIDTIPNYKRVNKSNNYVTCFAFGDISVRKTGNFVLLFSLFQFLDNKVTFIDKTLSQPFTVYTQKNFPGSLTSTPLTRFLYKHGARIRQRKRQANRNMKNLTLNKKRCHFEMDNYSVDNNCNFNKRITYDQNYIAPYNYHHQQQLDNNYGNITPLDFERRSISYNQYNTIPSYSNNNNHHNNTIVNSQQTDPCPLSPYYNPNHHYHQQQQQSISHIPQHQHTPKSYFDYVNQNQHINPRRNVSEPQIRNNSVAYHYDNNYPQQIDYRSPSYGTYPTADVSPITNNFDTSSSSGGSPISYASNTLPKNFKNIKLPSISELSRKVPQINNHSIWLSFYY
ncbi:uncharacterized protein ASCRUDRAFT_8110 [Ascoidea rubescens DSM 1968]|uniref:Velvet domain-containing protein n=1 Tax=Ascoidea rubescens DSM 1968 TaxID=1344418 RepID=A0A1D2VHR0_9ASCO|nr:hypothetical protein ASCRUDRAFT_8110 [Ascoidea rubescens DSM 1968]ODV61165.1 hypothetical protein ASCRUDRAFT_8110 [Ascoidea rubescens DSM 1968]